MSRTARPAEREPARMLAPPRARCAVPCARAWRSARRSAAHSNSLVVAQPDHGLSSAAASCGAARAAGARARPRLRPSAGPRIHASRGRGAAHQPGARLVGIHAARLSTLERSVRRCSSRSRPLDQHLGEHRVREQFADRASSARRSGPARSPRRQRGAAAIREGVDGVDPQAARASSTRANSSRARLRGESARPAPSSSASSSASGSSSSVTHCAEHARRPGSPFGGAGLGEGQAEDAAGRRPVEQQPQRRAPSAPSSCPRRRSPTPRPRRADWRRGAAQSG